MSREKDWRHVTQEEADEACEEAAREDQLEAWEQANNLPFTWKGEPADPWEEEIMRQACALAGREDLLTTADEYDMLLGDYFYITDVPQGKGDSRAITNKYERDAKLIEDNSYYMCRQ